MPTCAIIEGNVLPCRTSVGGVEEIYLTEIENKSTLTATSGVITAFTMVTGKKFWTYKLDKENASFNHEIVVSPENGTRFSKQDGTFTVMQLTASNRNQFELLAANRLMVIVKDSNGTYWLYGEVSGLDVTSIKGATGKARGDMNGYTLTLSGSEKVSPQQVTASLMTTLTVNA